MPLGNPITIRFEDDELEALKEKAREDRRPVGFVVREAVRAFCFSSNGSDTAHSGDNAAYGHAVAIGTTPTSAVAS